MRVEAWGEGGVLPSSAWVPNISLSNDFTNEFREIAARRSDQLNERVENRQELGWTTEQTSRFC